MNIDHLFPACRAISDGAARVPRLPTRPVCGGCLAVIKSHGLDLFTHRDPYCFLDQLSDSP